MAGIVLVNAKKKKIAGTVWILVALWLVGRGEETPEPIRTAWVWQRKVTSKPHVDLGRSNDTAQFMKKDRMTDKLSNAFDNPVGFEQYIGDLNIKRFGGMVLFVFCFVWEKGSLYQTDRVPWNCFKATFSKTVETTLSSDRGLLCVAASWLPTLSYLSEGLVIQWDNLWWPLCYANF